MEQFDDKSHEATPHRRQKAEEEGHVPRSQDLTAAVVLLAALLILYFFGGGLVDYVREQMVRQLSETPDQRDLMAETQNRLYTVTVGLAWRLLPVLGGLMLAAIGVNLAQSGPLLLPEKVSPDIGHLNPLAGLERIFSLNSVVRLGFGILKMLLVATVAVWAIWSRREEVLSLASLELLALTGSVVSLLFDVAFKMAGTLLILALLDYMYQRWKYEQDLMMTTQEVKEEMKNTQGDPQTIARRRALQRQMVLNNMNSSVPEADVVVTNPTELAVALRYDPTEMAAPVVVAKGAGVVAQRIRLLALEHGVPIVERKELARALYRDVEVQRAVPLEQYAAVAEVLRYVYELKGRPIPGLDSLAR